MKKILLLLILFTSLGTGYVFAQKTGCGNKYDDIEAICINKHESKFKEIKFEVTKKPENIVDKTYFYITETGDKGKFIVRSSYVSKNECSLNLDATTFLGNSIFTPNATFSIKNKFNTWGTHKVGFGELGTDDFALTVENGKCVFKSVGAKATFYKKTVEEKEIMGNDLIYYAGLFLMGLAVFLVARTVFQDEDRFKAQEKLEDADNGEKQTVPNDVILKYSRPFFKRYFTPVVAGMKNKKKIREKYKRKLASSGMNRFLTPEDFYAFKLFLILGFPIVFMGLREFLEESWPLTIVPLISGLGYLYPDFWINGKIAQRRVQVLNAMPFAVDMLALSVEAGLDFVAAMSKVIEKAPPSPLVEEFENMIKETKVGATRAEGLRQMAWRINALPMSSFCATLIAADSVGANIGPILKTLAVELRQKKSAQVEKLGAQAATKILFPTIFFILPAVGLVIAAPIALELMGVGK